jgi:hypothetical protein
MIDLEEVSCESGTRFCEGLCTIVGFGISGAENLDLATRELKAG